jgi:predicted amidophosphoribosyltransferase
LAELDPDLVAAVPMHWRRRLLRGTNSPEVLARHLARHLRIPLAVRMLVRGRNTLPQADLTPGERFQNVLGAFRLGAGYDLRGARVVLVDDILTTGATCSEAAKVFKRAGAAMVVAVVAARAEGPHTARP